MNRVRWIHCPARKTTGSRPPDRSAVLFFTGPLEGRRFVEFSENSFYWYFVVGAWVPIHLVVYRGARAP